MFPFNCSVSKWWFWGVQRSNWSNGGSCWLTILTLSVSNRFYLRLRCLRKDSRETLCRRRRRRDVCPYRDLCWLCCQQTISVPTDSLHHPRVAHTIFPLHHHRLQLWFFWLWRWSLTLDDVFSTQQTLLSSVNARSNSTSFLVNITTTGSFPATPHPNISNRRETSRIRKSLTITWFIRRPSLTNGESRVQTTLSCWWNWKYVLMMRTCWYRCRGRPGELAKCIPSD